MDPKIFRKGDAESLLAYPKTWEGILDKPDMLDEVVLRITAMCDAADGCDYLVKADTMKKIKAILADVLVGPLTDSYTPSAVPEATKGDNTILIDILWDEIEGVPASLKDAIARIMRMKEVLKEINPLTNTDGRDMIKEVLNTAVLEPLKGRNNDE